MVAYYVGFIVLAVLMYLPGYLPKKEGDRVFKPLFVALILYLLLGGWLFGWPLGVANITIIFVVANLASLVVDRIVHRFWPNARYRIAVSRESAQKARQLTQKLGINPPNRRLYRTRDQYPEDDPVEPKPHDLRRG